MKFNRLSGLRWPKNSTSVFVKDCTSLQWCTWDLSQTQQKLISDVFCWAYFIFLKVVSYRQLCIHSIWVQGCKRTRWSQWIQNRILQQLQQVHMLIRASCSFLSTAAFHFNVDISDFSKCVWYWYGCSHHWASTPKQLWSIPSCGFASPAESRCLWSAGMEENLRF